MRLTLHTDYALRIMMYLAGQQDRLCSISEIAGAYAISHNHLMKVAHALVRGGLVASARGRTGGLSLARPAAEITVGEIVRCTEDGFDLVDCTACRIAASCRLQGVLGRAAAAFLSVLDGCALAELSDSPAALAGFWRSTPSEKPA